MESTVVHAIFAAATMVLLGASAAVDLTRRLIPNELVIAVAGVGLAYGVAQRPDKIWLSLGAALIVFCALAALAYRKFLGGGDMKLISAVSLAVSPNRVGELLIDIALAGGVLSCVYFAAHWFLNSRKPSGPVALDAAPPSAGIAKYVEIERARIASGDSMPYALAIFGGVMSFNAGELFRCVYATSCSL